MATPSTLTSIRRYKRIDTTIMVRIMVPNRRRTKTSMGSVLFPYLDPAGTQQVIAAAGQQSRRSPL
jgi:hypothetical protein